jgi:hypothetical protein
MMAIEPIVYPRCWGDPTPSQVRIPDPARPWAHGDGVTWNFSIWRRAYTRLSPDSTAGPETT